MSDTVIVTSCNCGWVGLAPDHRSAHYNYHDHLFHSTKPDTEHMERPMAMSNPIAHAVIAYLRNSILRG